VPHNPALNYKANKTITIPAEICRALNLKRSSGQRKSPTKTNLPLTSSTMSLFGSTNPITREPTVPHKKNHQHQMLPRKRHANLSPPPPNGTTVFRDRGYSHTFDNPKSEPVTFVVGRTRSSEDAGGSEENAKARAALHASFDSVVLKEEGCVAVGGSVLMTSKKRVNVRRSSPDCGDGELFANGNGNHRLAECLSEGNGTEEGGFLTPFGGGKLSLDTSNDGTSQTQVVRNRSCLQEVGGGDQQHQPYGRIGEYSCDPELSEASSCGASGEGLLAKNPSLLKVVSRDLIIPTDLKSELIMTASDEEQQRSKGGDRQTDLLTSSKIYSSLPQQIDYTYDATSLSNHTPMNNTSKNTTSQKAPHTQFPLTYPNGYSDPFSNDVTSTLSTNGANIYDSAPKLFESQMKSNPVSFSFSTGPKRAPTTVPPNSDSTCTSFSFSTRPIGTRSFGHTLEPNNGFSTTGTMPQSMRPPPPTPQTQARSSVSSSHQQHQSLGIAPSSFATMNSSSSSTPAANYSTTSTTTTNRPMKDVHLAPPSNHPTLSTSNNNSWAVRNYQSMPPPTHTPLRTTLFWNGSSTRNPPDPHPDPPTNPPPPQPLIATPPQHLQSNEMDTPLDSRGTKISDEYESQSSSVSSTPKHPSASPASPPVSPGSTPAAVVSIPPIPPTPTAITTPPSIHRSN